MPGRERPSDGYLFDEIPARRCCAACLAITLIKYLDYLFDARPKTSRVSCFLAVCPKSTPMIRDRQSVRFFLTALYHHAFVCVRSCSSFPIELPESGGQFMYALIRVGGGSDIATGGTNNSESIVLLSTLSFFFCFFIKSSPVSTVVVVVR